MWGCVASSGKPSSSEELWCLLVQTCRDHLAAAVINHRNQSRLREKEEGVLVVVVVVVLTHGSGRVRTHQVRETRQQAAGMVARAGSSRPQPLNRVDGKWGVLVRVLLL